MHTLLKTTAIEPLKLTPTLNHYSTISPALTHECRQRLLEMHQKNTDREQGGLLSPIKFIDRDSTEYALVMAKENDDEELSLAMLTLDNAMALIDPVWGGVYQYSTQSRWDRPHYRKTMATQAAHLRLYALAYAQTKLKRYFNVTHDIIHYMSSFLANKHGSFYKAQQDTVGHVDSHYYFSLSDQERHKIGLPEIDKRILTRDNGWAIEALATHAEYCLDHNSLFLANTAMNNITKQCYRNNNGWCADTMRLQSYYLADNLAMARAALQLYRVTLRTYYLELACATINYINKHFRHQQAGYTTLLNSSQHNSTPRQIDENISISRFANLLFHYTGNGQYQKMAEHGLRYLSMTEIATSRMEEAGILLLDREMQTAPITFHLSISQSNLYQSELMKTALSYTGWYKRLNLSESGNESVIVEIDGVKSKPVNTVQQLKSLLHVMD